MKLWSILLILFIFLVRVPGATAQTNPNGAAAPTVEAHDASRVRLAILGFSSASLPSQVVADAVTASLVKEHQVQVIERNQMDEVLKEIKLGSSGLLEPGTEQKLGQIQGVDYLVYGSVDAYSTTTTGTPTQISIYPPSGTKVSLTLTIRVTKVSTAQMVSASSYHAEQLDRSFDQTKALQGALGKICDQFEKNVQPLFPAIQATITQLKMDTSPSYLRIDLGSKDGVRTGDLFEIVETTQDTGLQGQVIVDKKVLCAGRVFEEDDTSAKLELGTVEDQKFIAESTLVRRYAGEITANKCTARCLQGSPKP